MKMGWAQREIEQPSRLCWNEAPLTPASRQSGGGAPRSIRKRRIKELACHILFIGFTGQFVKPNISTD
jgi:hypothetical protein